MTIAEITARVPADKYLFWEVRMGVRDIIADLHIPVSSLVDVVAIEKAIIAHAKETGTHPRRHTYELINFGLYIDGTLAAIV